MGRTPEARTARELTLLTADASCDAIGVDDPTRTHHRIDALPAWRRFDDVECTVSHLLRFPHPALRGLRYGEALLQGIAARGIAPGPDGVLEIGGGAGHIAEAAWRGDAGPYTGSRWVSLDLSPALIRAQRRRMLGVGADRASVPRGAHERWHGVRADAIALPLRQRSFGGLILANEVLADLPVDAGVNVGAAQLVREAARVLAPGGAAVS